MLRRSGTIAGARYAFSDRYGGLSRPPYAELNLGDHVGDDPAAVAGNRRRLAEAVGLDAGRLVLMSQVHGAEVAVVDAPPGPGEPAPTADALVTTSPGLGLVVLVADCVPVLLAARRSEVRAVVHAGRRGVESGVVGATVTAMTELGARADRVVALVGPAVCPRCYEVPAELADQVAAAVPAARSVSRAGTPGARPAGRSRRPAARGGCRDGGGGPLVHRRGAGPLLPPTGRRDGAVRRGGWSREPGRCQRRPAGRDRRQPGPGRGPHRGGLRCCRPRAVRAHPGRDHQDVPGHRRGATSPRSACATWGRTATGRRCQGRGCPDRRRHRSRLALRRTAADQQGGARSPGTADVVHSVDRLRLVGALDRAPRHAGRRLLVLVQVDLVGRRGSRRRGPRRACRRSPTRSRRPSTSTWPV